jgi:uncharacterized protein (TIGR02996 family)
VEPLEARLRTHPHDRDAWLVYGDWLQEQGDVRGRLILLEQRMEAQPELQAEVNALKAQHQAHWGLRGLDAGAQHAWRCGFVIGVTLPMSVESLELLPKLVAQPEGRLLTSVRLRSPHLPEDYDEDEDEDEDYEDEETEEPDDEKIELFDKLAKLDLPQVTSLDFSYGMHGPKLAQALSRCPSVGGLLSLDLRFNRLGDKGADFLGKAPLEQLLSLHLQQNDIGHIGARALAESRHLRQLTLLDLRSNELGPEGARALAGSPIVSQLGSLYLHRSDLGPDGARALAESEHLPFSLRRYWKAQ